MVTCQVRRPASPTSRLTARYRLAPSAEKLSPPAVSKPGGEASQSVAGRSVWDSSQRLLFGGLGTLLVAIAFVGVFLPGVPTTGPLIGASILLAKSNAKLERKLLASRVFRNYLPYLERPQAMPFRARLGALACMWVSISASCLFLSRASNGAWLLITLTVAMGLIGTATILLLGRLKREPRRTSSKGPASPIDLIETQLLSTVRSAGPSSRRG